MICYTVRCEFSKAAEPSLASDWVRWLRTKHMQDVMDAGAIRAELVFMDGENLTYEVRYRFASRELFNRYESDYAPRLREEGLKRFPLELGLSFSRTVGTVLGEHGS
ncbi:MAG: DUF4286 family protein [Planctomycetaceae bacterium]